MAEVCESVYKPVDGETLAAWTVRALREDELNEPGTKIVSIWHKRAEHGYPTPFLGRDEALACVSPT